MTWKGAELKTLASTNITFIKNVQPIVTQFFPFSSDLLLLLSNLFYSLFPFELVCLSVCLSLSISWFNFPIRMAPNYNHGANVWKPWASIKISGWSTHDPVIFFPQMYGSRLCLGDQRVIYSSIYLKNGIRILNQSVLCGVVWFDLDWPPRYKTFKFPNVEVDRV